MLVCARGLTVVVPHRDRVLALGRRLLADRVDREQRERHPVRVELVELADVGLGEVALGAVDEIDGLLDLHPAHQEIERDRLHVGAVAFLALLVGGTGEMGDVPVAGRVDDHIGENDAAVVGLDAGDRIAGLADARDLGLIEDLDAGLADHLVDDPFHQLGVEQHPHRRLALLLAVGASHRDQPVDQFLGDAAHHLVARIERLELHQGLLVAPRLVPHRDDARHEAAGHGSAEVAHLLDQRHRRPGTRRRDRRCKARRPAAGDHHLSHLVPPTTRGMASGALGAV